MNRLLKDNHDINSFRQALADKYEVHIDKVSNVPLRYPAVGVGWRTTDPDMDPNTFAGITKDVGVTLCERAVAKKFVYSVARGDFVKLPNPHPLIPLWACVKSAEDLRTYKSKALSNAVLYDHMDKNSPQNQAFMDGESPETPCLVKVLQRINNGHRKDNSLFLVHISLEEAKELIYLQKNIKRGVTSPPKQYILNELGTIVYSAYSAAIARNGRDTRIYRVTVPINHKYFNGTLTVEVDPDEPVLMKHHIISMINQQYNNGEFELTI